MSLNDLRMIKINDTQTHLVSMQPSSALYSLKKRHLVNQFSEWMNERVNDRRI